MGLMAAKLTKVKQPHPCSFARTMSQDAFDDEDREVAYGNTVPAPQIKAWLRDNGHHPHSETSIRDHRLHACTCYPGQEK